MPTITIALRARMGLAAAAAALALAAHAQSGTSSISIQAQPLGQAINALALQTGARIIYAAELTEQKTAPAVSGTLTVQQALEQLLAGSGLVAESRGNEIVVRRAPAAGPTGSANSLPEVVVTAEAPAPGELPPAYAGGQVATGGRVGLLGNKDFLETPFSTISYTEKLIGDRQAKDITSVIAATDPTVFTSGSTGMISESYSIRGFSSSISDVAINGLYGVTPYYRTSPEMFERIEVLKGPSALLNGMPPGGSVGGSVSLVPKRAGNEPLTRVTATYESDALFGGHVDIGRRFGEGRQFGIRVNGVYRDGDTAVNNQSKETNLLALALDWRGERARLSADLYASKDHADGLNRGISLASGLAVPAPPKPETLLNPTWSFTNTEDKAAIFRGELDVADTLTAYAALGISKTDFDALAASTYQVFNDAGDFRNNVAHQRSIFNKKSAEAGLKGHLQTGGVGHEWALNATQYRHTNKFGFLRNMLAEDWITNIYNPVWGPSVGTAFSNEPLSKTGALRLTSFGLADTLSFAQDKVLLTLGVRRQEVVSDTFDATSGARTARYDASATTPAVALLVKATNHVSVYGNYIEGLSQGATAPATADNAGEIFPPYKTRQKEIGVKFDFGEFAHTVSLYEIRRPSSYTDPATNVYSFGGEQRNRGIEWGFFGSPLRNVRLMGGIAYVEPKLTRTAGGANQGKLATGIPKWQGKLGAEWDIPAVQGLTLTANAISVSRQYISANNSQWVPGRTVYDLGARYATSVAGHPLTLRASVANVTNKAYWATTLSSGLGAPRTFLLSASVDF